jgi:hypothetical protein
MEEEAQKLLARACERLAQLPPEKAAAILGRWASEQLDPLGNAAAKHEKQGTKSLDTSV